VLLRERNEVTDECMRARRIWRASGPVHGSATASFCADTGAASGYSESGGVVGVCLFSMHTGHRGGAHTACPLRVRVGGKVLIRRLV
jgi:hypothetical protein